jgi:Ca2+-binding RTX toxin-like protein
MRKTVMLVAIVAILVMSFATAAYAAMIQGTNRADILIESPRNDQIYGYGGNDELRASRYGGDADALYGGSGNDILRARDGDPRDTLRGGTGYDRCYGGPRDAYYNCEEINGVVQ